MRRHSSKFFSAGIYNYVRYRTQTVLAGTIDLNSARLQWSLQISVLVPKLR